MLCGSGVGASVEEDPADQPDENHRRKDDEGDSSVASAGSSSSQDGSVYSCDESENKCC
jgi:hypothetical protein